MTDRKPTSIMTMGGYFDPLDPQSDLVSLDAIGHSLGRLTRFAGHTHSPDGPGDPLRVAAHSMRVARIAQRLLGEASAIDVLVTTLGALLHDAAEAYTGDRLAPIKTDLERKQEAAILSAIVRSLGLRDGLASEVQQWTTSDECHVADKIACAQEALLFQPGAIDWAMPANSQVTGVSRHLITSTLDLFWPRPGECWTSAVKRVLEIAYASKVSPGVLDHAHAVCAHVVSPGW